MIGLKFYKDNYDLTEYSQCAEWCNQNNATIEDKGTYYECVEIPAPPIEEIKSQKIAELKSIRNAEELSPITYNGYRFDFDKDAIMRMELAERSLHGSNNYLVWTDADNNRVSGVYAEDFNTILALGTVRSNELHIKYNELKALVENAQTVDDVNAIKW